LASLALGLFIVATAARTPFTAQLARAAVPEPAWHTPVFLRVIRQISLAWGSVALILGGCHLVGAFLAFLRVIAYTRRIAAERSSH